MPLNRARETMGAGGGPTPRPGGALTHLGGHICSRTVKGPPPSPKRVLWQTALSSAGSGRSGGFWEKQTAELSHWVWL